MGDELEDPYYHDMDMLSTQASNRDFSEHEETPRSKISDLPSATLEPSSVNAKDGSGSSRQGSEQSDPGQSPSSLCTILRTALARVGLDDAQETAPAANPFFRRLPPTTPFSVPPSPHFLRELQMCWADPRAFAHHSRDSRLLSTMRNAEEHGLDHMPAVDHCVTALVLSPDGALRDEARCPSPQCQVTDDLLTWAYDTAACMARLWNSISVLMLAQAQMLQPHPVDSSIGDLNDASLQAFASMSRELGRLMSTLVVARRQVWLAQAPLSDDLRGTLRKHPVILGRIFGPAAERALESRQQQGAHPPPRLRQVLTHNQNPDRQCYHLPSPHGGPGFKQRPPSPKSNGARGHERSGLAVGRFTQRQLAYWAAHTTDTWVLTTLSHGYRLQFQRRPPLFSGVRITLVTDPLKARALCQEIVSLLEKGAITRVKPSEQLDGFYSTYFLVRKKEGGFRPVLELKQLNVFLKVLPFHMLRTAEGIKILPYLDDWLICAPSYDRAASTALTVAHVIALGLTVNLKKSSFTPTQRAIYTSIRVASETMVHSHLLAGEPWQLLLRQDLLSQLDGRIWHHNPGLLQLWVWPLKGPTP
ncbi:hypothetical protein SKAU_G00132110 [Synaphobranchus kaupii]|uniref:Reverse transcriptase domain-containing protein n=1 Tax=Synaphobranchus kaupii TaxID=118154 RepID=A0A9Q1FRA8_SYNKA|nr:hypothetical protein SKAU_G00132110 [Synaphobranchus kaupii]